MRDALRAGEWAAAEAALMAIPADQAAYAISLAFGGSGIDGLRPGAAPIAAQILTLVVILLLNGLLLAATFAIWRGPSAEAYRVFHADAAAEF